MGITYSNEIIKQDLSWWVEIQGDDLLQGDYLENCPVPVIGDNFNSLVGAESEIEIQERSVIILTQSCDLENKKAPFVALSPIYTLEEMQSVNPKFKEKGKWESVRNGRMEGLHMLASFNGPDDNASSLVVDFRQIYSLPFGFLVREVTKMQKRRRLNSPYLEHFAQAFARFFMRVGLPSAIKKFES